MEIKKLDVLSVCWQVIVNPHAFSGKRQKLRNGIFALLKECRLNFQENIPNTLAEANQTLKRLYTDGFRHFIFLGGDGTANVMVNGIFLSGIETDDIYLVPIPVGTGNDWIRTHNYPSDYHEIIRHFKKGEFAAHDIGIVKSYREGKNIDARLFINIAGFCFDAEVIQKKKKNETAMFASATYLYNLIKTLFGYQSRRITVRSAEATIDERLFTIAVGICKYNGKGMKQVPMADPFDGYFDVVVIRKLSPLKVIANVKNLFSGKHLRLREVSVFRTRELEIIATPYTFGEVEGELLTLGNYKISMIEQKVNVLMINE